MRKKKKWGRRRRRGRRLLESERRRGRPAWTGVCVLREEDPVLCLLCRVETMICIVHKVQHSLSTHLAAFTTHNPNWLLLWPAHTSLVPLENANLHKVMAYSNTQQRNPPPYKPVCSTHFVFAQGLGAARRDRRLCSDSSSRRPRRPSASCLRARVPGWERRFGFIMST